MDTTRKCAGNSRAHGVGEQPRQLLRMKSHLKELGRPHGHHTGYQISLVNDWKKAIVATVATWS
jgi:hypothetical protein